MIKRQRSNYLSRNYYMSAIFDLKRNSDALERGDVVARLAGGGLKAPEGSRLEINGNVAYAISPRKGKPGTLISQLRGQEYLVEVEPGDSFLSDVPTLSGFIDKLSFVIPESSGDISDFAGTDNVVFFILPTSSPIPSQAVKVNPRMPGAPSAFGH